MTTMRDLLLRCTTAILGWGGALLFLAGTVSLTGGRTILGVLSPAVAIVGGGALAMGGFVVHLVHSDSVRARRRRRPR